MSTRKCNAYCPWCNEFDLEDRWCYTKQRVINRWNIPRNCSSYQGIDGIELEGETYNKLSEVITK